MTRRSPFSSHLYSQIVVPLIVASVGLALVASIVAIYYLQDLTNRWVSSLTQATTVGVVERYQQFGDQMHRVSTVLAADADFRQALNSGNRVALNRAINAQANSLKYSSISVVDSSGAVVASAGEKPLQLGQQLVKHYPGGVEATSADTVFGATSVGPAITVLQPMLTDMPYRVAISQVVDEALLGRLSQGSEGAFCFYTPDGKLVACFVSPDMPPELRTPLEATLASATPTPAGVSEALKSSKAGLDGFSHMSIGGTGFRLLARPVKTTGEGQGESDGFIVASISEAITEEASRASMNLIFIWSSIAVMALVGLGFWVARRVSDPLIELADGARRLADGDFSTKVHVSGSNEIARLGSTFNDMTDSLRDRSESLTKKVLELATLYEMSRALGSTLDMDELLGSTLDSALRIFDLDVGYVALRDRDSGALAIRAVRGSELQKVSHGDEAVRSSMAEWVVREGRPLIFNPDPGAADKAVDALTGAKAALCVPLVSSEGTIGAITVGSSDDDYRFNSEDVRLLSTIGNHVTIAIGNIELFVSLQDAYLDTVRSLAAAVDAKDSYTRGHSDKVASYATLVAEAMGLSHDQRTALEMAAYLHDIGKIGVPEEILLKPGTLSGDEMAQMRHHPLIGANILKPVAFPWAITPIVRHHHEHWDGTGYPAGLKGEEIPLLARVLCVADSFEAMTADRPYRTGRSAAEAITELEACSGTQFDPQVVRYMVLVVEELERSGSGIITATDEDMSVEEVRAIFAALVDGVMESFRRLGGPRLASNAEAEVDAYFESQEMPYRLQRAKLTFTAEPSDDLAAELDDMHHALQRIDAIIGRVSGDTLVDHFYDDAFEGFSARMRQVAVQLDFHTHG